MSLLVRPSNLSEYIAEPDIKNAIDLLIRSSKLKHEPPPHLLISGPPGTGKTSLVYVLANELSVSVHEIDARSIQTEMDLRNIFLKCKPNDIIFIDEIHGLQDKFSELMYKIMEDNKLAITMMGKSFYHQLPPFTMVGATTDTSALLPPLFDRFRRKITLPHATIPNLVTILINYTIKWCNHYGELINISEDAFRVVAGASRGAPRISVNLMENILDYFLVTNTREVFRENAVRALDFLCIDEDGLTSMDRRILSTIFNTVASGAIAGPTLAAVLGISENELYTQYEPYLISHGYIMKGPRGRTLSDNGFKYISSHN